MSDSTDLQAAYILHQRVWQESSFIVEAFTLNYGRVVLMAKGARTSKPNTRALYEPFRPLLISWVGRSELKTLTGIEDSGTPLTLEDKALASAYYINEILLRLLGKEQTQQDLFAHYALALSGLSNNTANLESILRTFELQLLNALGVCPEFAQATVDGTDVDSTVSYRYYPTQSVAVPEQNDISLRAKTSVESQLALENVANDPGVLVDGKTLIALAEHRFDDDVVLQQAKKVMRQVMATQLGDKPLKSRELFSSLALFGRDQ